LSFLALANKVAHIRFVSTLTSDVGRCRVTHTDYDGVEACQRNAVSVRRASVAERRGTGEYRYCLIYH